MATDSGQNMFDAPALAQTPEIRSFEFDPKAIGQVKNSVNKFRGTVSLPLDFLNLPGRDGLDVKLSVLYSSSISNVLNRWNIDSPTGILGLGWQMPIEMIVVETQGSAATASNLYYLVSNGAANPLVKTGQDASGNWLFQARNYQFWNISYDPRAQLWTIIKENGFIYRYGDDGTASATQWGVRWGNWLGAASTRAGQLRYPVAWNLASVESTLGHSVKYIYQNVSSTVMQSGLDYTQASYLAQVIDSYGRILRFNYGEKYGALNPGQVDGQPVLEYQAPHTDPTAPNAYQDRYETRYLDSVDLLNSDNVPLYGMKFTYGFVNTAPVSDPAHALLYKRTLQSVFEYAPDGETLPPMRFAYVPQNSDLNPCALAEVTYPAGGRASFAYKRNFIASPRKRSIANPLPGSLTRVWFGADYTVLTYAGSAGMRVQVWSWNGQWVNQDVTGTLGNKTAVADSLQVLTGAHFFALSFRNKATGNDELYLYRNDDAGAELRFGTWQPDAAGPITLALKTQNAGPSHFAAGNDFVIARNKDFSGSPFQGFSYSWTTGQWNSTLRHDSGAPPVPPATAGTDSSLTAAQNFYTVSAYDKTARAIRSYLFYRDLDGSWKSSTSNPFTLSNVDVLSADGQILLAASPLPTGIALTFVTKSDATSLSYSVRVLNWNENYFVINLTSPGALDLTSPIRNGQSQHQLFQTLITGALLNNNLGLLRNIGGDQSQASIWSKRLFNTPGADAAVTVAAGDDVALFSAATGSSFSNQLLSFNPNNNLWQTPSIAQDQTSPSISGDYLTLGRYIYVRGTNGAWVKSTLTLSDFNFPASLHNFGPHYIVYQDVDSASASTRLIALKNGAATALPRIAAEKCAANVTSAAGTQLAGPRFLVTYPASATSLDVAPSINLYDLSDVNLDTYVAGTPVAYLRIADEQDPAQSYAASYFYGNSSTSQIVYNAATGVAQYPQVTVVEGVAVAGDTPPANQPQGRSIFYYSNGLSQQAGLYPAGGLQNYQNILNGIELASQQYDSSGNLVASQLNYWKVYSQDISGKYFYGGYARCERITSMQDGVTQESYASFSRQTGLPIWQEKTYFDADGTPKRTREETLYAFQVPEYASAFTAAHDFSTTAQKTRSAAHADGTARVYTQSQATAYKNWAGSGPARWAAEAVWDWTDPGTAAPVFAFGGGTQANWQLKTRILSRTTPGFLITEQIDGAGLVSSFVYDNAQANQIAIFPNASLSGNEAAYYGFAPDQTPMGWVIGSNAAITPNQDHPAIDAHTGSNALRVAPATSGASGISASFTPARNQPYVFSAWMKKPAGFNPAAGEASWRIAVTGQPEETLPLPDTTGAWLYVYRVVTPPGTGSFSIAISLTNANTGSAVLVDDLRVSPLASPLQAYAYSPKFRLPSATLGANGETGRLVYDSFQQPLVKTNPADELQEISRNYFSVQGHQGRYSPAVPNHALSLAGANGGRLTRFHQGDEWQAAWQPTGPWQVDAGVLTQTAAHQPASLACADPRAAAGAFVLDLAFTLSEIPTAPLGMRFGGITLQWEPESTAWHLFGQDNTPLAPPVDTPAFSIPGNPYLAELDAGIVSPGLTGLFLAAGYMLPAASTVATGSASPRGWTLTAPDHLFHYALKLDGAVIKIYPMNHGWTLLANGTDLAFWADGQLIFSQSLAAPVSGPPSLFFGDRVAISAITTGFAPQANVQFTDSRGLVIQTQAYAGGRSTVVQAVADSLGRLAVRSKPAFVTAAQNPLFAYSPGFALMDWQSGTMSGLVSTAYPQDEGYPFSRQSFEASPLARLIEEGVPGALFSIGAHSTTYAYGSVTGAGTARYASLAITNPNGDRVTELRTALDQIIRRTSDNGGLTLRSETFFDDAGNPVRLRAPNYFAPPAGSTPDDWVTLQNFDWAGRLLTLAGGGQGTTRFLYDHNGNLRFTQDPQGASAGTYNYTRYDILARQLESGYLTGLWDEAQLRAYAGSDPAWPPTPPTWRKQFTYDGGNDAAHAIGRLVSMLANNGDAGTADVRESLRYNLLGDTIAATLGVTAYADAPENPVDYDYDNRGNITCITYPATTGGSRLKIHYQINPLNQITAIAATADFAAPLARFSFNAAGLPETNQFGPSAGITQDYSFNSPFWLTNVSNRSGGTILFGEDLTYTDGGYAGSAYYDGTIASATVTPGVPADGAEPYRYSYDSVGQILNAQNLAHPERDLGVSVPVDYDANGNFLNLAAGGTALGFAYAPGTQKLETVQETGGGTVVGSYLYDANGNATRAATAAHNGQPGFDLTLAYDPGLGLTTSTADAASGTSLAFTYGGRSERVLKHVSGPGAGQKLYIRGTNTMPVMERSSIGGQSETHYIYGPGGLIAFERGGNLYLIARDHLGSVRAVIGTDGAVAAAYDYLTYGGLAAAREPAPGFCSYLYTGQEYDAEIGLYNYRARFYDGRLGRFLAADVARQYFSPYIYASNNPVLYIDPTGMFSIKSFFSAIAGIILGAVEIFVGVVIDVIAGIAEVLTGGLSTPASLALAALSGVFYGAGVSAITYSVFNFNDFSWKDYGLQTLIGAAGGAVSGAVAAGIGMGITAAATSVSVKAGTALAVRGGEEAAASVGSRIATGALKGTKYIADTLKSTETAGGVLGYAKGIAVGVAKSEAIGLTKNTVQNLATGNDWDTGLGQAVFSSALSGSIGGFQVKLRVTNDLRGT